MHRFLSDFKSHSNLLFNHSLGKFATQSRTRKLGHLQQSQSDAAEPFAPYMINTTRIWLLRLHRYSISLLDSDEVTFSCTLCQIPRTLLHLSKSPYEDLSHFYSDRVIPWFHGNCIQATLLGFFRLIDRTMVMYSLKPFLPYHTCITRLPTFQTSGFFESTAFWSVVKVPTLITFLTRSTITILIVAAAQTAPVLPYPIHQHLWDSQRLTLRLSNFPWFPSASDLNVCETI